MRVFPVLFFAFLLLFRSSLGAQTPPPAPDPKAFEAVGALSNGVQSHDAVVAASAYADDAVVLPPTGQTIRGKAAIEAFWKQQFTSGFNAVDGGLKCPSPSARPGY